MASETARPVPGEVPDVVDLRLRELARLSAEAPPWPPLVDMSPEAVTARLDECAEISALALDLVAAGVALR